MMSYNFDGSDIPLISLKCSQSLNIGYCPEPFCDIVLDPRGRFKGSEILYTDAVVAKIYFSPLSGEVTFTPLARHTRILFDGRNIDYKTKLPVYPGTRFTFGIEPYERTFMVTQADYVQPLIGKNGKISGTDVQSCELGPADLESLKLREEVGNNFKFHLLGKG